MGYVIPNSLYGYKFDAKVEAQCIQKWVWDWMATGSGGAQGVLIGMSGGKDSAVAAALCCNALGNNEVRGLIMPYDDPNGEEPVYDEATQIAIETCQHLNMQYSIIPLCWLMDLDSSIYALHIQNDVDAIKGNIKARLRMMCLYAIAQEMRYRVCCTSNASEIYLGYSTKYGDFAGDFAPLSHLTASQVIEVGRALKLPEPIISRPPEDGLSGKTDEANFGFTYGQLDLYLTTGRCDDEEIKTKIENMHSRGLHKSVPIPHLT